MTILQYIDPVILTNALFFSFGFALGAVIAFNINNKKLKEENRKLSIKLWLCRRMR